MEEQQDKRTLHALRKHVDEMLAAGATIVSRDPVTLLRDGQTLKIRHGMLVGYSALLDLVEPISDHEWPDALRQMAIDLCIQQLDEAIRALEDKSAPARLGHSANDS
ncbi:hypothetical protein MCB86_16250 [Pseudomonas sp. KSR10]|jgi:hypothetical protein|uniref:Uncharacterized protein n=2 Tax=Pseudomonadaceae TaxID=135621 RepID=A0A0D9AMJ7_STUST|nr:MULTISPECIES: hypothetical protein [Pseudomonadaceae]KJH80621.1 hypothetical protein UF78_16300 [Stutzerimonas stutzeri]MCG6541627.1 hypothetical protein [Pseudomonas sp. KSR10]